MSKYNALWEYIRTSGRPSFVLTFEEIQHITGIPIDHSFLRYKKELEEYGYQVGKISLKEQRVSFKATPHNSARSLSQNFCPNSKFQKWRNTVCISHFWNCGSGAKRRLRIADAIVQYCLNRIEEE